MGELDCTVCLSFGEVGEFHSQGWGWFDVDNLKVSSNEKFRLCLNTCRWGCVLALLSIFSSFCVSSLQQLCLRGFILVWQETQPYFAPSFQSSAVCNANAAILWIFHKQEKKSTLNVCVKYKKNSDIVFLIVLCSHFNLTSSQRVVLLFLLKWNPCCIRTEEMLLLLRSWTNSSLCSLSTSAGVMDLQCFLCCRVALLLLLCKTFCWNYHTNDWCCAMLTENKILFNNPLILMAR